MRRGRSDEPMNRTFQRSVSLSLVFGLLLLGGVIYAQIVPHTLHHAHHQAATHGTTLCTWLCAAGQGLDGGPVILQADSIPFLIDSYAVADEPISVVRSLALLRGPPLPSA